MENNSNWNEFQNEIAYYHAKKIGKQIMYFVNANNSPIKYYYFNLENIKTIRELCNEIKIAHSKIFGKKSFYSFGYAEDDGILVMFYEKYNTIYVKYSIIINEIDQSILQTNGKDKEFEKYLI